MIKQGSSKEAPIYKKIQNYIFKFYNPKTQFKAPKDNNFMTKAEELEAETKSRGGEFKAFAMVKQITKEGVWSEMFRPTPLA